MLYALEAWACRSAAAVSVLTPAFQEDLERRGLATPENMIFAPNGVDTSQFVPGPPDPGIRREFGWGDRFVVLYAGAHGRANAVGQLVDTAERLKDHSDILIACVGDGPERGKWAEEARRRGLSNIVFHGAQPKEKMPAITRSADVGTAVLQNNPTFKTVYPNKVFDYMACARPVLLAIDGAARKLVCESANAGTFAEPESPDQLAAAIRELKANPALREEMGARGLRWVQENASRDGLARKYLDALKKIAGPARPLKSRMLKGLFDRIVASLALILLSPVLLAVMLAIRLTLGRPVFFRQERPGLHGIPFQILKFRTMRDGEGSDEARLTRFGSFLRSSSLDELPELLNVLGGEMSLVGPRPLLMRYLGRYTAEQARRHDVKPGITGWAQVNGRNSISWDDKFKYDVWYVDHASFFLDLKILLMTVGQVLGRRGISAAGEATMPEFKGSAEEGTPH
jgi:lipopolysaccharide/colanic/teichoic acid biosynthesis glycosyltransferase